MDLCLTLRFLVGWLPTSLGTFQDQAQKQGVNSRQKWSATDSKIWHDCMMMRDDVLQVQHGFESKFFLAVATRPHHPLAICFKGFPVSGLLDDEIHGRMSSIQAAYSASVKGHGNEESTNASLLHHLQFQMPTLAYQTGVINAKIWSPGFQNICNSDILIGCACLNVGYHAHDPNDHGP